MDTGGVAGVGVGVGVVAGVAIGIGTSMVIAKPFNRDVVVVPMAVGNGFGAMLVVLQVEAAAAFDELTRSNRDDELTRQVEQAWPNVFRAAQLVPGVQYVQAQRARTILMEQMEGALGDLDGYVTPSFAGGSLLATNLTGHPTVVVPHGFREDGTPLSLSFVGRNYREGEICALAAAYQGATDWHRRRPNL